MAGGQWAVPASPSLMIDERPGRDQMLLFAWMKCRTKEARN